MVCQDTKVVQFFADFCNFSGQLWYLFFSGKRAIISNKKHRNKIKKETRRKKGMRLWKKVSAMVAMAAVCMTMAVPVTASAAEVDARLGGCPDGCVFTLVETEEVDPELTRYHTYDDITTSPGGTIHHQEVVCAIETVKITTYECCNGCGIMQAAGCRYITRHTKCGK